jgi:dihydrofolate reductase
MSQPAQVIGDNNKLLWHIPADLKRFKALTLGHPIIMGRKTFESIVAILGKPLPQRTNIVVTRDTSYKPEGVLVAHSLAEAIALAERENPTEIHIGGGGELYKEALPLVSRLHITWVKSNGTGDTVFPDFLNNFTVETEHEIMRHEGLQFQWVDYEVNGEAREDALGYEVK